MPGQIKPKGLTPPGGQDFNANITCFASASLDFTSQQCGLESTVLARSTHFARNVHGMDKNDRAVLPRTSHVPVQYSVL